MGLLASEVFSITGSENHTDSEITVNEINFADYNTHPLWGVDSIVTISYHTYSDRNVKWLGQKKKLVSHNNLHL